MNKLLFVFNSILLGAGLAMDAFSVSIANGLGEPGMARGRMRRIAGVYGFFQFLMPMAGWVCVHTIVTYFTGFQKLVPWIALWLLLYIGGKMLFEGVEALRKKEKDEEAAPTKKEQPEHALTTRLLLLQGIATSIDALSVGFTIADYTPASALVCSAIVAVTTYLICMAGLLFGKRFGEKLSDRAAITGGLILIGIGLEIWIRGNFLH